MSRPRFEQGTDLTNTNQKRYRLNLLARCGIALQRVKYLHVRNVTFPRGRSINNKSSQQKLITPCDSIDGYVWSNDIVSKKCFYEFIIIFNKDFMNTVIGEV